MLAFNMCRIWYWQGLRCSMRRRPAKPGADGRKLCPLPTWLSLRQLAAERCRSFWWRDRMPFALSPIDLLPAGKQSIAEASIGQILFGRWSSGEEVVACRRAEDRVEVHCHGSVPAVRAVVESLRSEGCREISWKDWVQCDSASAGDAITSRSPNRACRCCDVPNGGHLARSVKWSARRCHPRRTLDDCDGRMVARGRIAGRTASAPRHRSASHVALASRACRPAERRQEQSHQRARRVREGNRFTRAGYDSRCRDMLDGD